MTSRLLKEVKELRAEAAAAAAAAVATCTDGATQRSRSSAAAAAVTASCRSSASQTAAPAPPLPPGTFALEPADDGTNLHHFTGYLVGPADTPYAHGVFHLDVRVPTSYPLAPPRVRFTTPVFHPNVHARTGEICLDVLRKEAWSPAWSLAACMRAIVALLAAPAADSPLNCDAGNLLRCGDARGYAAMARMYTELLARAVPLGRRREAGGEPRIDAADGNERVRE